MKLQFSAPSAGIVETAKHLSSPRPLVMTLKGVVGFEPRPPDCSGCKVSGLQHGATTPKASSLKNIFHEGWIQTI